LASEGQFCRGYADTPTDEGSEEQSVTDRADSGQEASTSSRDPNVPEDSYWPERRKGKRPTRTEKGSWVGQTELLDELVDNAPIWPENVPMYDFQGQAPFLYELSNPVFLHYQTMKAADPEAFDALLEMGNVDDPPPRQGSAKILQWELNVVFEESKQTGEPHPLNKKVKCHVYLRDLQREFNLTDAALQHIALICGPRYNPNKGLLTLTSEKYREREENRLHVVEMLTGLVKEGQRAYPSDTFKEDLDYFADESAAEAATA